MTCGDGNSKLIIHDFIRKISNLEIVRSPLLFSRSPANFLYESEVPKNLFTLFGLQLTLALGDWFICFKNRICINFISFVSNLCRTEVALDR